MNNQISIEEITKKLRNIFPQVAHKYEIVKLKHKFSEVKLITNSENLRPGNTISGPSMFELADLSFYIAVMASSELGEKSVTTNVSINFIKTCFYFLYFPFFHLIWLLQDASHCFYLL